MEIRGVGCVCSIEKKEEREKEMKTGISLIALLVLVTGIISYAVSVRITRNIDHVKAEAAVICAQRGENDHGCQLMRDRVETVKIKGR